MRCLESVGSDARRWIGLVATSCLALVGCKSDLSQQLLERELRYQEDQIYQLQDELQEKCARVDYLAGENVSLKRQLGISESDSVLRSRPGAARATPTPAPAHVPPSIEIPEAIRGPAPSVPIVPPSLDNIPPLPVRPSSSPVEPEPLDLPPPASSSIEPAPASVPVAYEEPMADGRPVRLVVTQGSTSPFDDNGDGLSDGIAVTVEPRDAAERLVPAPGAVTIVVQDAADPALVLATASIPTEQAAAHFRPTTRLRGLHFRLPWTAGPITAENVRVTVSITGPEGALLEADATIPSR